MMNRDSALKMLRDRLKNDKLLKHCLSVEAIMRRLALRLGEDDETWGLVGLLHDIDYELVGKDLNKHGLVSAEILRDFLPEKALNAIRAHNELTGFKDESKMAVALRASDQISGLIVATALVMPNKKLSEVRVKSVLKKMKQKDFARSVDRERIREVEKIGLDLREFIELALNALREISGELGL